MAPEPYRCIECRECFIESCGKPECVSCGETICEECSEATAVSPQAEDGPHRCSKCANDLLTKEHYRKITEYLLGNQSAFKSAEEVREKLRQDGQLPPFVKNADLPLEDDDGGASEYEISDQDDEEEEEEEAAAAAEEETPPNDAAPVVAANDSDARQPAKKRPANHARCMQESKRPRVA